MDQPKRMRLEQRTTDLQQDVNHPLFGQRSVFVDQILQGDPVEVLHRVVEHPFGGPPVIEDRDRVGMVQLTGDLHLPLEPLDRRGGRLVGVQQLDRRRARRIIA